MSTTASHAERSRERALEELRVGLQDLLGAHRRLRSRDSRGTGIGFAHFRLLWELQGQALTSSELAQAAGLAPPTVTEMLDTLVAAGLVERQRDECDRRVIRISMTRAGRRKFEAKRKRLAEALAHELADLDDEALEGAAVVLGRLGHYLDGL